MQLLSLVFALSALLSLISWVHITTWIYPHNFRRYFNSPHNTESDTYSQVIANNPILNKLRDMDSAARSPHSPRLPSPPPIAELQIAPRSPSLEDSIAGGQIEVGGQSTIDAGPTRRIRPGTKAADMASGPPLVPLNELDSAFQLQEHLKALYHRHTHAVRDEDADKDESRIGELVIPLTKETSLFLATPPPGIEQSLWLYELCRLVTNSLNVIVVAFFNDAPPCSAATCPEMRASEWQYLCAVHDPPKSCCAIDYCCHTLDSAANMLTSTKNFPSRLSLGLAGDTSGSGAGNVSGGAGSAQQGLRHLTNIFRRLYRIFAHAWFQHRRMFWQVERERGLYVFFKTICDYFHLIPEDSYTIPPEAEGDEPDPSEPDSFPDADPLPPSAEPLPSPSDSAELTPDGNAPAPTQRRHKSTPSTGAFVNTVPEEDEGDESGHGKGVGKGNTEGAITSTNIHTTILDHSPTALMPPVYLSPSLTTDRQDAEPEKTEVQPGHVSEEQETEETKSERVDEKAEVSVDEKEPEAQDEKKQADPDEDAVVEGSKVEIEGEEDDIVEKGKGKEGQEEPEAKAAGDS
ncbi:MAG: hypothetical protein M1814_001653 [Vezdaea aestivalis]|nr:MAG: hypothetical protein M1814_001653 [Vezdaea aestivalis]